MESFIIFNTLVNHIIEFSCIRLLSSQLLRLISGLYWTFLNMVFEVLFPLLHMGRVIENKFIEVFIIVLLVESVGHGELHDGEPS